MQYHPHIHYVVPGGALSKDDGLWHPSRQDFYLPVKALSKIFRAKFRHEKHKSECWRTMQLDVMEFMRRFLQHVLPTGFMMVRYYGFLNPNCSGPLDEIETKIQLSYGFDVELPEKKTTTQSPLNCPHCGGKSIHQLPPEKKAPG